MHCLPAPLWISGLAFGLIACGGDDSTGDSIGTADDCGVTDSDPSLLDRDGDGYTEAEGDCNDDNGAINASGGIECWGYDEFGEIADIP